jgi:hypothetical protein
MGVMDFLARTFGDGRKVALVRELVKKRIAGNALVEFQYGPPEKIDQMSDIEVLGWAEGTIVTIVESYYALKTQGLSDSEIFRRIEAFRSSDGSPIGPYKPELLSYIKYRLFLEYDHHDVYLFYVDIPGCIREAQALYCA